MVGKNQFERDEADSSARRRARRLAGLLLIVMISLAGIAAATALRPTRNPSPASPLGPAVAATDHVQPEMQVTWSPPTTEPLAAADDDPGQPPHLARPVAIPLPSAGLGGIALLVVMALWRRANLRSTTRLH